MPQFGLGVYKVADGDEVRNSVLWALECGYRSIDTAAMYGNEKGVGEALRLSGLARESVFITTKVWNDAHGYQPTLRAFDDSLSRLEMDYVDMYMIHWPVSGLFVDTWKALEAIYQSGRTRSIGVSNFLVHHLEDLCEHAQVMPMVDQVEFHPYLQQPPLQQYCRENDIHLQAWSPLMRGAIGEVPEVSRVAEQHAKTPAQVALRWAIQKGVLVLVKSVHRERIISNAQIYDFELSDEEMGLLDGLDREQRFGTHPDKY
jgi:diketogulonate reductase-like aldo/keto reductase